MKMSWQFGSNFYHSKEVLSQDAILHLQRPFKIRDNEQLFRTLASLAIPWPMLIIHFFFFKEFKGPNYGSAELRENE